MYFNFRTGIIKRISTVGNIVLLTALAQNCAQNRLQKNTDPIQVCILNEFNLKKLKVSFSIKMKR